MRMISSLQRPAAPLPASTAAPLPEGGAVADRVAAQDRPRPRDGAPRRPAADGAGPSASTRRPPSSDAEGRPSMSSSRKKTLLASRSGTFAAPGSAAPRASKAASLHISR